MNAQREMNGKWMKRENEFALLEMNGIWIKCKNVWEMKKGEINK